MKMTLRILLCGLIILQGAMPCAFSQGLPDVLAMPDARVGQLYRVSVEKVLKEKYSLRLETGQRAPVFRWALAGGELPSGLVLRAGGTIAGTPKVSRPQPYFFEVKVVQINEPGMEPLRLTMSMSVASPQITLVQVNSLKLVPLDASAADAEWAGPSRPRPDGFGTTTRAADAATLFAAPATAGPGNFARPREGARRVRRNALASSRASGGPVSAGEGASAAGLNLLLLQNLPAPPPGCDIVNAPSPTAPASGVFYLDARSGNLTENKQLVTSRRRFKKGERVVVVIDNKNPYLYTYRYSATATPVPDAAINAFVPLLLGNLAELGEAPEAPEEASEQAMLSSAQNARIAGADSPCKNAKDKSDALLSEVANAAGEDPNISWNNLHIRRELDGQKRAARKLASEYNAARVPLFAQNQTRANLHAASAHLVTSVSNNVGDAGANFDTAVSADLLDQLKTNIDRLEREANRFKSRIDAIREAHPTCLDIIGEDLRRAGEAADDMLANVENYRLVLTQITKDLSLAVEGRTNVLGVLCNEQAFFDERGEGDFEATNKVDIKLEVTPRQGVTEASAVSGSPFSAEFTFGGGPFFSLSGGLIFSPLRKREYVRVQGFERDQQGGLVLDDEGEPNLTTVIGLKESSPTRITPALFLNGRVADFKNRVFDGLHLSLGITAKNDNEGTDVEFLVGPSLSMLDGNMFLTFGGYAGRQQKLAGNLFEGFAVPADVEEIPIEKNYRWNAGFSLSYRIPVGDK